MAEPSKENWLMSHLLRRMSPDAGADAQRHSAIFVLMLVVTGFTALFALATTNPYPWLRVTHAFGLVWWGAAGWAYVRRRMTLQMLAVVTCLTAVYIVALDVAVMSHRARAWAFFVLLLDMLLVFRAPQELSLGVVGFVCCYLTVSNAELSLRFGLLDLPGMLPYDERRAFCECEKPPCETPITEGLAGAVSQMVLFLIDFYLTRGFATQVLKEKQAMKSSVDAAEHIAASLAEFDLPAAEAYLDDCGDSLPADLLRSLSKLLENLHTYRPFLPSALFDGAGAEDSPSSGSRGRRPTGPVDLAAPGLLSGRAALVFTDIRSSTALWETSGALMKTALSTHNQVIRSAVAEGGGYEVKTIGDAFMLAFESADAAVTVAAEVQTRFANAELWPEGLARPGMDDGYPAMCIRIGMHVGDVTVERNELTGRFDYFGPTANKAARVEANGVAGAVTVTKELLKELEPGLVEGMTVVEYPHARLGKGLTEPLHLAALLPEPLCGRKDFVLGQCTQRRVGMFSSGDLGVAARQSSPTTSHSGSFASAGPLHMWQRTARSFATVGVVRYAPVQHLSAGWGRVEADLARRAETLYKHLRTTGGQVSTMLHDQIVVSWGVQSRLSQHVASSARFLILLQGSWAPEHNQQGTKAFHAGVATGAVACGQVAASRQERFVTLLGPCVNLAAALCLGAAELTVEALVAALGGTERYDTVDTLRIHVRPVDTWCLWGVPEAPVTVYELDVVSLWRWREKRCQRNASPAQAPLGQGAPTTHDQYCLAFARRDVAALEAIGKNADDAVVASVARFIEHGRHLPHALAVCLAPDLDAEMPSSSNGALHSMRCSSPSAAWLE